MLFILRVPHITALWFSFKHQGRKGPLLTLPTHDGDGFAEHVTERYDARCLYESK